MTIIWCTTPEISSVTDRIFCHFGSFFALLSPKNLKNQNFEKMKKKARDNIILQKCTRNHDHMLHCSWDTMCDRSNSYFLFWAIFYPFTPNPTTQKIKIKKIKNTPGGIIILQMCTKNNDHIMYGSWNMVHDRQTDRKSGI